MEHRKYFLRVERYERPVPHQSFNVRYSSFRLYVEKPPDPKDFFDWLTSLTEMNTTSKSNVNKLLTGLLLDWKWDLEGEIEIPKDKVKYLKIILRNQKDYKFWRDGLKVLNEKGKEECWKWIEEQVPILELRNKLKG